MRACTIYSPFQSEKPLDFRTSDMHVCTEKIYLICGTEHVYKKRPGAGKVPYLSKRGGTNMVWWYALIKQFEKFAISNSKTYIYRSLMESLAIIPLLWSSPTYPVVCDSSPSNRLRLYHYNLLQEGQRCISAKV